MGDLLSALDAERVLSHCMHHQTVFTPVNTAMAIVMLFKMLEAKPAHAKSIMADPMAQGLLNALCKHALALEPRHRLKVLYCVSKLGIKGMKLEFLAEAACQLLTVLTPDGMAGVAWACQRMLGPRSVPFIERIAQTAIPIIDSFSSRGLLSLVSSAIKATKATKAKAEKLLSSVGERLAVLVREGQEVGPHQLSWFLLGFAEAGVKHEVFLEATASPVIDNSMAFRPEDLARIAYSFWELGDRNKALMQSIGVVASERLQEFSMDQLKTIQMAYADCDLEIPEEWIRKIKEAADAE